ncbi:YlxR family protein [Arenivirga flava]|uniref:YlxR domain-containing protein n=1 Tax=Arenivirga flava TaxID=1930060 RepID=A0AA37UES3_9MICO|nr:YlxR family protein [Arenivirga flava]GMA27773.1 hypothetical protein GCM10025874_10260 [Arenivirga flava]
MSRRRSPSEERAARAGDEPSATLGPVRTCVGCRARAERSALVRIVAGAEGLVLDERAVLPGRGAWLHPSRDCWERAISRRALGRALRTAADPASNTLREQAERLMDNS